VRSAVKCDCDDDRPWDAFLQSSGIDTVRSGHISTMPRTATRSPQERFEFARRIFIAGALFEIGACIALLFLLSWPKNVIVVAVAAVMLGSYNVVFWRTIKKQAAEQTTSGISDSI
jgi:hypothetical protein